MNHFELAEPHCDGVDLNLGCPQVIAGRVLQISPFIFHLYAFEMIHHYVFVF